MTLKSGFIFVLSLALAGCFNPDPKSLNSDSAPSAVPAIKDAGDARDHAAIPRLITDLDDPDPAIRFAAITALTKITGLTMDYDYYQDDSQRRPAVQRWKTWLSEHPNP